jgi:hypothetical protein
MHRSLCSLLCPSVTPDAVLDKAGVWGSPVSADSPLLSPATLAKLAPGEAAAVPLLAQSLLLQHGKRLKGGADRGWPWGSARHAWAAESISQSAARCGHPDSVTTGYCVNLSLHRPVLLCDDSAGAREAVCRLLPLCLLHHSPEVRRPAVAAAKATLSASPGLMGALLAGLRHWANNTREALVLVVSRPASLGWGGVCRRDV